MTSLLQYPGLRGYSRRPRLRCTSLAAGELLSHEAHRPDLVWCRRNIQLTQVIPLDPPSGLDAQVQLQLPVDAIHMLVVSGVAYEHRKHKSKLLRLWICVNFSSQSATRALNSPPPLFVYSNPFRHP